MLLYGRWTVMGRHTPAFKAIDNPAAFSDNLFTKVKSTSNNNLFKIWYIFLYVYFMQPTHETQL